VRPYSLAAALSFAASPGGGRRHNRRQVAVSATIYSVSFLVSGLAAARCDLPQTVHVAFMSLKPLFFAVRGDMERVMAKKKKAKKKTKSS